MICEMGLENEVVGFCESILLNNNRTFSLLKSMIKNSEQASIEYMYLRALDVRKLGPSYDSVVYRPRDFGKMTVSRCSKGDDWH